MSDLEQKRREVRRRLIDENEFPNIPENWSVERLRFLFTESKERNGKSPVGEMLSVSEYRGVVPRDYEHEDQKRTDEELENYRVVRPGQLAVNSMWLNHLGLGVSEHTGHVSPAYNVYDISERLDRRFVHHLMRSNYYLKIYLRYLYGIRPNSFQIKSNDWASIPIIVPDLATQRQIADFLDRETARIDLLIEKKQRLVALLGDHWDRFTFDLFSLETSTRFNLDKSAWEHQKLKFLSPRVTVGIVVTPAAYYTDDGVPAIRGTNIRAMDLRLDDIVSITDEGHRINKKSAVAEGDVVVVRTGQPGTAAVVPKALDGANCIDVILVKKSKKYLSDLLAHFLNSSAAKAQYSSGSSGAIQQHFNISIASNLVVPVPPLHEQERVLRILRQEGQRIRNLTSALQTSIDRLKEYRSALITAAVTGQIDVSTYTKSGAPDAQLDAIQEEMGAL